MCPSLSAKGFLAKRLSVKGVGAGGGVPLPYHLTNLHLQLRSPSMVLSFTCKSSCRSFHDEGDTCKNSDNSLPWEHHYHGRHSDTESAFSSSHSNRQFVCEYLRKLRTYLDHSKIVPKTFNRIKNQLPFSALKLARLQTVTLSDTSMSLTPKRSDILLCLGRDFSFASDLTTIKKGKS